MRRPAPFRPAPRPPHQNVVISTPAGGVVRLRVRLARRSWYSTPRSAASSRLPS